VTEKNVHLVKVPLRADRLAALARRRQVPVRDLDADYLAHCLLRELWQEAAPAPFLLKGNGRVIDVLGYSRAGRDALIDRARAFGDPAVLDAIDDLDAVAAKEMPRLETGRRVGFRVRACPVVRLAKGRCDHRAGAEIDAFLARCFEVGPSQNVDREEVYRAWLAKRFENREVAGVELVETRVIAIARERFIRRTQGEQREARRIERPDVTFAGELVVTNGVALLRFLAHGIGRHRAFGFGALMLVPPGQQQAED
jgi:CRISPR system Cascade subunit CasE